MDLHDYRRKLSTLTKLEQKQRDVYLSKISKGIIFGPSTGYPTIDKPQLKYMTEENILLDVPAKNVYQEIYDNNKDYPNNIAIQYFGKKITYRKFFEKIDKTAKAFLANGVKKGDYVTIYAAGTPEILYTFYGLARLGAVASFMDPFALISADEKISNCNVKIAVVMDKFLESTKNVVRKSTIERVVVLPTLNSSPLGLITKSVKPDKSANEILWDDFIKSGKGTPLPADIPFEHDMPVATVCSSGSTGVPKQIVLTHDSFENSVHAYPKIDVIIERGQLVYQVVPPWASTGLSSSIHMPLIQGAHLFMDPRFERKVFVKNNLKFNPYGTIASTSLFRGFLDESLLSKKGCLSHQSVCFQGGEKVEMKEKLAIEEVFKKYNSHSKLMNGYGQCECGAGICTQTKHTPANATVGIPIPGVTVMIADSNKEEVLVGKCGEILVNTPCGMKEYLNNPEKTNDYFYFDKNNIKWNCTGDYGFINENGELTVLGRASDYSIVNGKKIFNFDLERIIFKMPFIQNCDVFTDDSGELVAHVILKDNYDNTNPADTIRKIQSAILDVYQDSDYIPEKYKFRDEFPAGVTSKRDVAAMKAETDGFIRIPKEVIINQVQDKIK